MTEDVQDVIKSLLKSREKIKQKIIQNRMNEDHIQKDIIKFQAPIVEKLNSIKTPERDSTVPLTNIESSKGPIIPKVSHSLPCSNRSLPKPNQKEDIYDPGEIVEIQAFSPTGIVLEDVASVSNISKVTLDVNSGIDDNFLKQFNLKKPSTIMNIKNDADRISTITFNLDKSLELIKQYRAHTTNAKKSNDEKKLKSCLYINEQLKHYKTTLENIKQIPKYTNPQKVSGYLMKPNEIVERLNLLISSKEAGNDSIQVYNEIIEILDYLLRQKLITKNQHKKIYKNHIDMKITKVT